MKHLATPAEDTDAGRRANSRYGASYPSGRPIDSQSLIPLLAQDDSTQIIKVAAVAVLNASGQILVGFNKKRHVWDIPQGVIENGELPVEAAVRELAEETGIIANPHELESMALFRHRTPEFVFPWETTLYIANVADVRTAHNAEPDKCLDLKWFAPVQLPLPRGLSLRILLNLLGRE